MRNIENQLFAALKKRLEKDFPKCVVSKDYQTKFASFPAITMYEIVNSELEHTLDYTERKSDLSYQIDIFTVGSTKQTMAKSIAKSVNAVFEEEYHMNRLMANQLPNADHNIYRYTMRYSCKLDECQMRIYS